VRSNLAAGLRPFLRGSVLRTVFLHLGLFVAFIILSRLSTVFPMTELRSTPWNPETGLAVAAGLLLRGPAVVTTAAAIFVSTRLWGWPLPGAWEFVSAALRSLVFVGSASMAAPLLLRNVTPTLQTVIVFFGFSALITALYAVVRLALLWLSVSIEPVYLLSYTATLSIGNLLGILTLVPLFMITDKNQGVRAYLKRWSLFQWAALAGLVIVSFVVFGISEVDEFKFFYLVFIPVIVFAVRDGYVAAALSVFLSDLLMIGVLYWRDFESSTATELQFLMLSLSATGLLLGTAISERARAVEDLKQSHLKLQESQSALLQASRLSLASEMAAALAHELNQPLSSVRNFVRAVRRRLEFEPFDREAAKSDIDAAVAQVDSAASLLRSTRSFLERGSVQRSPLELQPLVSRCRQLVQAELRQARIALSIHDMSAAAAGDLQRGADPAGAAERHQEREGGDHGQRRSEPPDHHQGLGQRAAGLRGDIDRGHGPRSLAGVEAPALPATSVLRSPRGSAWGSPCAAPSSEVMEVSSGLTRASPTARASSSRCPAWTRRRGWREPAHSHHRR
jgi:two-component system, LuxR family, sensor kinase FixL